MKKLLLAMIIIAMFHSVAYAGFLTGNSSPYITGKGVYAVKINTSILMTQTPFSSVCLLLKYGYSDKVNLYAKCGLGTIDYTTDIGVRLTSDPQASAFGMEYMFAGTREAQYSSFVAEYETVSWSINRKSNTSNEILLGMDIVQPPINNLGTRYRLAMNNFNAGTESDEKMATTVKYSFSTELEYYFTKNIRGSFEAGIYFGDPNGVISTFGFGFGFGS